MAFLARRRRWGVTEFWSAGLLNPYVVALTMPPQANRDDFRFSIYRVVPVYRVSPIATPVHLLLQPRERWVIFRRRPFLLWYFCPANCQKSKSRSLETSHQILERPVIMYCTIDVGKISNLSRCFFAKFD